MSQLPVQFESETAAGSPRGIFDTRKSLALILAALMILVVGGMAHWITGASTEELAGWGYAGVFLAMLVSGSSTFIPVPGHAAVLVSGAMWNPILVGIAAGLGNATGEAIGYMTARLATSAWEQIGRSRWVRLARRWFDRYGVLMIVTIAAIPNPIFDVIGIVAAMAGYPLMRFWLACALGNCLKYVGWAYFGKTAGSFFGICY